VKRQTPLLRWIGACLGAVGLLLSGARDSAAGAFIFAGESNGVNTVTHPTGYFGSGGTLQVSVCIRPSSPNASQMEIPVQNAIHAWNTRAPVTGNVKLGGSNDIPANLVDFESTVAHELGHCIGLAHPNLATESGLTGDNRNYTKSTDGSNNQFDINDGADNVIGSSDDVRGDDVNLHFFRKSDNNPFGIASTVDSTTYSRLLSDLPQGQSFATNADRTVAALLGVPNTEAVMQQGAFIDEDQRQLGHDDVATLLYGMAGLDEIAGNGDDYTLELTYAGLSPNCDIVLAFDNGETGFAVCQVSGLSIGGTDHFRITSAESFFNTGFNWYFNQTPALCGNGSLDGGEECDDGNAANGDCCSSLCEFETAGSACEDGDLCTEGDVCNGAGVCNAGGPRDCDDGVFCNGSETCDSGLGCQAGTPVDCSDGVGCTVDACDAGTDACTNTPDDGACQNGQFCDGDETCDPVLDCQPGPDPCAPFGCDEGLDVCGCGTDADCDDAVFCNGAEACVGGFCAPGAPVDCDDGVGCTVDACDAGTDACTNTPDAVACQNGQFCDGQEVCDLLLGCMAGAPVDCDDGVACSVDSCNEASDACDHVPDDAQCDDGLFCTGSETCDAVLDCQPGGDPCPGLVCDEVGDRCETPPEVVFADVQTGGSADASSVSTSAAVTAVAGDLYLAVITYKPDSAVSSVTGLGLSWSLVGAQCSGRSQTGLQVWQALGTPSGSGVVTASLTSSPQNSLIAVARYTNVQSNPVASVVSGNTNGPGSSCEDGSDSDSYSFDLTTTQANARVVGAVARRLKSHTPGSGYEERVDSQFGTGGSAAGLALEDRTVTTPGTVAIDGSLSSNTDWAVVGLELLPAQCQIDGDCDDGLTCNGVETCSAGSCLAGEPVVCVDADPCTIDACDEALGCSYTPIEGCAQPVPAGSPTSWTLTALVLLGAGLWLLGRRPTTGMRRSRTSAGST
jgi:hypothetical protein